MRHIFIINPAAGKGDNTAQIIAQAKAVFEGTGESCAYRVTAQSGDAERFARQAAESGAAVRIYACGGDGTVNEVVNGAAGYPNAAVTVVPVGTGNDFVKIFGSDQQALTRLASFRDCRESQLDLIECNGRLAVNICSVGLDARVGLGVSRFKKLPISGKNAYLLSVVRCVAQGIHRNYHVEIDGEAFDGAFTMMTCCNGRWYGGSFCPIPDAMPDDGLLDFVLVKGVSRLKAASMVKVYGTGQGKDHPELIRFFRGREMKIVCDRPAMINVDGERLDGTQVYFRLSEKKLRFFYPAQVSYQLG